MAMVVKADRESYIIIVISFTIYPIKKLSAEKSIPPKMNMLIKRISLHIDASGLLIPIIVALTAIVVKAKAGMSPITKMEVRPP